LIKRKVAIVKPLRYAKSGISPAPNALTEGRKHSRQTVARRIKDVGVIADSIRYESSSRATRRNLHLRSLASPPQYNLDVMICLAFPADHVALRRMHHQEIIELS
jgi:hypothetical protein